MQISELSVRKDLSYELPDSQLTDVMGTLALANLLQNNVRASDNSYLGERAMTLKKVVNGLKMQFGNEQPTMWHRYALTIAYSPPRELDGSFDDEEMTLLGKLLQTGSAIETFPPSEKSVRIAGLNLFTGNWKYFSGQAKTTAENQLPHFTVQLNFPGFLSVSNDARAMADLRQVSDKLYLPTRNEDGNYQLDMWKNGIGSTSRTAKLCVEKTLPGEFTSKSEERVSSFYDAVKSVILQYGIIGQAPLRGGGTFGQAAEGVSLDEVIRNSQPHISDCVVIGHQGNSDVWPLVTAEIEASVPFRHSPAGGGITYLRTFTAHSAERANPAHEERIRALARAFHADYNLTRPDLPPQREFVIQKVV